MSRRVFNSSVMRDFAPERAAAREAVSRLRQQAVMAEDSRARAILIFSLYSGGPHRHRLESSDFQQEGDEATIALHEKGEGAAVPGPPALEARGAGTEPHLARDHVHAPPGLPRATHEGEVPSEDGTAREVKRCIDTPHSLRATAATLLLDAGVDIIKVEELLGHRHVMTTRFYDTRRQSAREGASHDVPI